MKEHKLKQGDRVVMHTCMEHDSPDNFGKIWTCRSDEFRHKGHDYGSIFLDGFSGSFSTEFLQKVNIEDLLTEKDATIKHETALKHEAYNNLTRCHETMADNAEEIARLRKALKIARYDIKQIAKYPDDKEYSASFVNLALEQINAALGEGDKQ